jgi:hypothetical protein
MEAKLKKDWFGREKSIEELHQDSKIWISEIEFISDELRFLEHLLSMYYIDCMDSGLKKTIDNFVKKISTEKKLAKTFFKLINNHENILADLIETNSVTSNKNFLEAHKKLDFEIDTYFKNYKTLKKEIFSVIEKIMKKKEQRRIALK